MTDSGGKTVVIADSTQLTLVDECPQKWVLDQIEGLEADMSYKTAMIMGSLGHKLLETYYKSTAALGISKAREAALDMKFDENTKVWILPDYKAIISTAAPAGIHTYESIKFELEQPQIDLVRDKFNTYWQTVLGRGGDIVPYSPEHVECGFSEKIYEDDSYVFILEGKIDLLGNWQGLDTIMDHKFQLRAKDLYKKSYQFRNYAMAANKTTLIINYIRLTKKVDDTTFKRDIVSFTPLEHRKWREKLIYKFFHLAAVKLNALEGLDVERRYGSCPGKYGYPCDYTPICETEVTNPELVQVVKSSQFHKKEVWKPW